MSIAQVDIALTYVACLNKAVAGGVDGATGLQMANMKCLAQTYKDKGQGYALGLVRDEVLGSLGAQIYDLVSGAIGLAEGGGGC